MSYKELYNNFYETSAFLECEDKTEKKQHFSITGVSGSALSLLIAGLAEAKDKQTIIVVPDHKTSEKLQDDLETILNTEINHFPSYRGIHLEEKRINTDIRLARLRCLQNLVNKTPGIYLIEIRSFLHPIINTEKFRNRMLQLKKGDESDFNLLVNYLVEEGFNRESMVETFGDMSVRGGIIDIFPPAFLEPVRVEFFGDTVESIRTFDINDQLSKEQLEEVTILPPISDIEGELRPNIPELTSSILSYFQKDSTLLFHQPEQCQRMIAEYCDRWHKESEKTADDKNSIDPKKIFKSLEKQFATNEAAYIKNSFADTMRSQAIDFNLKPLRKFKRNLQNFSQFVNELKEEIHDLFVVILCDNQGQVDRLKEIILEEDLLSVKYTVQIGSVYEGFTFPDARLVIVNDHELFERKHIRKVRKIYRARKVMLDELSLQPGDFVVHEDHGIGKYVGLHKIKIGKGEQEALKILYKEDDVLYLNVEKLPRLEKYTGQDGHVPNLNKLGGMDWKRLKKKTKKSIENITKELIQIYAKRASQRGHSFSPDSQWQHEFESSFAYEETPDQIKATWEIKQDMESPKPMDRLICGDVGFGKTEVALRAAFKAVNDGKQVAVLVPTTILAQQHYETFSERMASFPIEIEMLSRFRTKKEQKDVIEKLKDGTVDIVIGTHRLLSKDIQFKSLGLIVVDEEQRFGVAKKEKLKQMRSEVDVVTMTATPIPRTLHMSLLGIRDLSMINTPPKNRLPIITEVSEYDEELIREAILKELDRGGQVYFVHNRVQTIDKMVRLLEKVVPEAEFRPAHGQMKEKELEKVMLSFLKGEFSCLVSTMIIESGLDIPSVNTIIINQADHFGLAQLYQLRGRVGRSDTQAFAYFLTPSFEKVTDVSIKRLQTLRENTDLGSGFQIAMKDLEIRGAGNLIGKEQSGHINDVGYDMYTRLIKEGVAEQMGDIVADGEKQQKAFNLDPADIRVDMDISAYLPEEYIEDSYQRVSLYRKLAKIDHIMELEKYRTELADRFGPLPVYAENMITLMAIKLKASKLNLSRVSVTGNTFKGTFATDADATTHEKELLGQLISSLVEMNTFSVNLKQEERLKVELSLPEGDSEKKLTAVTDFLDSVFERIKHVVE